MNAMRNLLLALAAVVLAPSLALAGGGTKATGTIVVHSTGSLTTGQVIGVIIDPPASLDPNTATQAQFTAAGGKFITGATANETLTFKNLKAGNHTIVAFAATNNGTSTTLGTIVTKSVSISNGQTLNYNVSADASNTTTLTVTP
jgi:hypothetical protein